MVDLNEDGDANVAEHAGVCMYANVDGDSDRTADVYEAADANEPVYVCTNVME